MDMQHNKSTSVVLYGAGGHCKVVIDILEALGIKIDCIVDDNPSADNLLKYKLLKAGSAYNQAIVTIGNCQIRKKVVNRLQVNKYLTIVR